MIKLLGYANYVYHTCRTDLVPAVEPAGHIMAEIELFVDDLAI